MTKNIMNGINNKAKILKLDLQCIARREVVYKESLKNHFHLLAIVSRFILQNIQNIVELR
jgi:hypothetical protein